MKIHTGYSSRSYLIGLFLGFTMIVFLAGFFNSNALMQKNTDTSGIGDEMESKPGSELRHQMIVASPSAVIVVDGGGGGNFTTIQAAVNSSMSGDTIQINSGTYNESVNISGGAGSLTFIGNNTGGGLPIVQATAVHNAPAFFNATAETADFLFQNLIIRSDGTAGNEDGIRLDGVTGTVRILNNTFNDTDDAHIFIIGTGSSSTNVLVSNNLSTVGTVNPSGFVKMQGDNTSTINATITDNNSTANAQLIQVDPNDNSTMNVNVLNNILTGTSTQAVMTNTLTAAGITAKVRLAIIGNTISSADGDGMTLQMAGEPSARMDAVILNNIFTNIGSGASDDGIALLSGSTRSGTVNARIAGNTFGTTGDIYGSGISLNGLTGTATFNVIIQDNNFAKADPGGVGAAVEAQSNSATINLDTHGNTVAAAFARTGFNLVNTGAGSINVEDFNGDGSTGNTAAGEVQDNNTYNGGGTEYTQIPPIGYAPGNNPVNDNGIPVLLGDFVWNDTNGDGLQTGETGNGEAGVRIDLTGAATGTTFTDSNGNYFFSVLPGTYTLTVTPPTGKMFSPANQGNDAIDSDVNAGGVVGVTIAAGTTDLTVDAGLVPITTAANANISGRIVSQTGRGIGGVKVVIVGGSLTEPRYTQTNPFGYYRFSDLDVGEYYVVTVYSKRYVFSNPSRVISLQEDIFNADFIGNPR